MPVTSCSRGVTARHPDSRPARCQRRHVRKDGTARASRPGKPERFLDTLHRRMPVDTLSHRSTNQHGATRSRS